MATTYTDVVLSPAKDGDTVVFTGTDRNERVTFGNPHGFEFGVDLPWAAAMTSSSRPRPTS